MCPFSFFPQTVWHPLSQEYPPSNTYKLSFLKSLLAVYEKQEVCDELYNLIAELMAKKKNSKDEFIHKSYILVQTMLNVHSICQYRKQTKAPLFFQHASTFYIIESKFSPLPTRQHKFPLQCQWKDLNPEITQ